MRTEEELLQLLEQDPEEGMAALLEEYSGLLWAAAASRLKDPEDIRECVSEAFTEFYLHRQRFQPERGSLKGYLAAIALRCAQRRYRKNQRWAEAGQQREESHQEDFQEQVEWKADLEQALSSLDPLEEKILRMKYFGGMTAKEIAASLGLPYETVKKRHQRGVKKLGKILGIGFVVAALLALLAACAYLVLRHFGLVPGYGVNTSQEEPAYVLETGFVQETEEGEIHVEDAWWMNETLIVDLKIYDAESAWSNWQVEGLEQIRNFVISTERRTQEGMKEQRLICQGSLPEETGEELPLTLLLNGEEIPFRLSAAEETELQQAGFYWLDGENGGLLAVPRLEYGDLFVTIYPLNPEGITTYPNLVTGVWGGYGVQRQPVTVVAPDGSVLEGEADFSTPFEGSSSLDWYFGPAESGEYTLQVPYLFQREEEPDPVVFELELTGEETEPGLSFELLGGTLTIDRVVPLDNSQFTPVLDGEGRRIDQWWDIEASWHPQDSERLLTGLPMSVVNNGTAETSQGFMSAVSVTMQTVQEPGQETGEFFSRQTGWRVQTLTGEGKLQFQLQLGGADYCWNHPISIPMTVEPEPEWQEFSQSAENRSLTAVPRRLDGQVTVSLFAHSYYDEAVGYTFSAADLEGEAGKNTPAVTLESGDGQVYQSVFQPSRREDYTNWSFGEIPPGEYTLHVPWTYVREEGKEYHVAVPLPQQAGESLPVGSVLMSNGASLEAGPVLCLGPLEEEGEFAFYSALIAPNGAVSSLEEAPLRAELPFSYRSDNEDYTLLRCDIQLWITKMMESGGAGAPMYREEESGLALCGVTLQYQPGLYAADVTFANPVYRWNHPFRIPIVIPES